MSQKKFMSTRVASLGRLALATALSAGITVSEAAILGLPDAPLYLISSVEPNVLLTFDDSGSMALAYIPDGIAALSNQKRGCASSVNTVYYNPALTYDPPVNSSGAPLNATPTTFAVAYINGYRTGDGTVNLSTGFRPSWNNLTNWVSCGFTGATTVSNTTGTYVTGRGAFYFTYNTGCTPTTNNSCYTLVQHNNATAGGAWNATQQQNFANWYSYHRNRNLTAKTSAGRAFSRLGTNVRIGAQRLGNDGFAPVTTGPGTDYFPITLPAGTFRNFSGTNRTDFFNRLYNQPTNNWTPLREAMRRAGEHFTTQNPYLDNTALAYNATTNPERSCRQNLHVMMTDGYWNTPNGAWPSGGGTPGAVVTTNADNSGTTIPTDNSDPIQNSVVTSYSARAPYRDTWTGTLADSAFYYWVTDLRPTLTNNVPSRLVNKTGAYSSYFWDPVNDPATWQHMATFTIGLGIDGSLVNNTTTYNNLVSGSQLWPDPMCNTACEAGNRIDDLWHAAINGRGRYFNAQSPSDLVNAFTAIISDVNDRISSASSVAMNSGVLATTNYVYQSKFNSGDWSGQVLAYLIDPATGTLATTASWDASRVLSTQNYDTQRQILTYKPSTGRGTAFRWASLDPSQTALLNYNTTLATTDTQGAARLNWIRGDASNEGVGNNYRVRERLCGVAPCPSGTSTGWLGDTIDSTPAYVGIPPFAYPDTLESLSYSAYKTSKLTRTPVIYIGANDGMLHGFEANSGREVMAYVPGSVYSNLSGLTAPAYAHKYFVNGNHNAVDAFVNGAWRTVLAGSLRKGGQGIYALDVSTPEALTEGNAATTVLWEFNDGHDADMGYSFSEPVIVRMHNGKWAAIFGNGYNNTDTASPPYSTTGNAVLYILFIENGMNGTWTASDFVKIDTGVGNDVSGSPNGLASPAAVDVDGDRIVDFIYAGDLRGNMWRMDVRNPSSATWNTPTNRQVIFNAGTTKPITGRPTVGAHPASLPGVMVYFGTGKYLESTDASTAGATTQTFYGVWDNYTAGGTVSSSALVQQTLTASGSFRTVTDNPVNWDVSKGWYVNLPTGGERVVANPLLYGGVLIFTTVIPSDDPCAWGGTGWLMELNASNGGQLPSSPFDTNDDGVINDADLLGGIPAAGMSFGGIPSMPGILSGGNPAVSGGSACGGQDCKYINKSDGTIEKIIEAKPLGSEIDKQKIDSWRQVR